MHKYFGSLEDTALMYATHGYYEPYYVPGTILEDEGSTGSKANNHNNEKIGKNPCPHGAVTWVGGVIVRGHL